MTSGVPAPTKRELAQRITELETLLTDAITALAERVDDLTPPDPPPPPPVPQRWADQATPDEWEALQHWVTGLNDSYSLTSDYAIPDCWNRHPGVVEELAGIHQSWTAAALAVQHALHTGNGTDALAIWHDRSLWPCLERLKARTGKYQTMICTGEHTPNTPSAR